LAIYSKTYLLSCEHLEGNFELLPDGSQFLRFHWLPLKYKDILKQFHKIWGFTINETTEQMGVKEKEIGGWTGLKDYRQCILMLSDNP
jgi:hypothetical protein